MRVFIPQYFKERLLITDQIAEMTANAANEFLEKEGYVIEVCQLANKKDWVTPNLRKSTHRGILLVTEEIKAVECKEHVPTWDSGKQAVGGFSTVGEAFLLGVGVKCSVCGLKLRPTGWENY